MIRSNNKINIASEVNFSLFFRGFLKLILSQLFKRGVLFLFATPLFLGLTLFGVDEYSKSTVKILTVAQDKLIKVVKTREKYKKVAIAKFVKLLEAKKKKLTMSADLDGAIAVRDMITSIKDGGYDSAISETENAPKEIKSQVARFLKYDKKIRDFYKNNSSIIRKELLNDLNKQFSLYRKSKLLSNAITTRYLIKRVNEENFSLLDYKFTEKKKVKKEKKEEKVITKDDKAKDIKKSNLKKIILNSFKIGNNILTEDATIEKGRILVYFAESLDPSNKDIKLLRHKIEKDLYITVVPCNITEKVLRGILAEEANTLIGYKKTNPLIQIYCALLKYLDKDYKFTPVVANYINKYNLNMNIKRVLKINSNLFGGSLEADTIRMQIDTEDSATLAKLLQDAEDLGQKYPKNSDVIKLINDLKSAYTNTKKSKIKNSKTTIIKEVDCSNCNHTGWVEVDCKLCKDKNDPVCASCIGSGICYKKVNCSECSGKGSNWLGISCKKCNKTGLIKKRAKCPACKGTGKNICKQCNGTKKVRIKCSKCNGSGKINK